MRTGKRLDVGDCWVIHALFPRVLLSALMMKAETERMLQITPRSVWRLRSLHQNWLLSLHYSTSPISSAHLLIRVRAPKTHAIGPIPEDCCHSSRDPTASAVKLHIDLPLDENMYSTITPLGSFPHLENTSRCGICIFQLVLICVSSD